MGEAIEASPIVAIKKIDVDISICTDYKIGVNHQICSDSFSLTEYRNRQSCTGKYENTSRKSI